MFSGKTEELIRRLKRARIARQRVRIFKPAVDKRYAADAVVSHDEVRLACTSLLDAQAILDVVTDEEVVGIDEAQFFGPELIEVASTLARRGVRVILAGLDMDYRARPFGPMPGLLAIAEDVTKLSAVCMQCGGGAHYSYRLEGGEATVEVGGGEAYEPRCRRCYEAGVAAPSGLTG
jgi:thymidine kinase